MSKRKEIRQQREKQQQRTTLAVIAGVVVMALVVVVVLIAQNAPKPVGAYTTIEKKEWPQPDGSALGSPDAPVVVREFSDFQCPYCRQFNANVKDKLIEEYVKTGKVRFEFQHFIIIDRNVGGTESRRAAEASECAAEQNSFWDYEEMLFANQLGEGVGSFTDERLKAFAGELGLDTEKFNNCYRSGGGRSRVTNDEAMARTLSVQGTPSVFVNNMKVANPLDYATVKAQIDAALAGQ